MHGVLPCYIFLQSHPKGIRDGKGVQAWLKTGACDCTEEVVVPDKISANNRQVRQGGSVGHGAKHWLRLCVCMCMRVCLSMRDCMHDCVYVRVCVYVCMHECMVCVHVILCA